MIKLSKYDWIVLVVLTGIIMLVFQQISTSLVAQGIASGNSYNNSASYPRWIAILMGLLIPVIILMSRWEKRGDESIPPLENWRSAKRPLAVFTIFALYLLGLDILGYHLATPIMLASLMLTCGLRGFLSVLLPSILAPVILAYVFEVYLKIVLPGGVFHLNIIW